MAMGYGNLKAVEYFHRDASFSMRAIALAAGKDALDCLAYAFTAQKSSSFNYENNAVYTEAVRNGCMDAMKFLRIKGFPLHTYQQVNLGNIAASSGQVAVLQYLHELRYNVGGAAIAAAEAGHFDCLEYAAENGAPLPGESYGHIKKGVLAQRLARQNMLEFFQLAVARGHRVDTQTALIFAQSGNLEYLKYTIEHGARLSIKVVVAAAQMGHLACLQYLHQVCTSAAADSGKGCDWVTYAYSLQRGTVHPTDVVYLVARTHQWTCLEFLITHGCPMNRSFTTYLTQIGQQELYYLATAHGCDVSVPVGCKFAAEGNQLMLLHALEHGCARSEEIVRAAARHGRLQCLIRAHAQGCPWSVEVTLAAARGGHLKCLQYLHEHGCPWNARVRSTNHQPCILDYAEAHGCPRNEV